MHHFHWVDDVLHAEGVSVAAIAEAVGTPFYCYSRATLERHWQVLANALAPLGDPLIAYAVKANPNRSIIATLARLGAGADVVSEGEARRALAAGVPPGRILFSGVGKTAAELGFALDAGLRQIHVESEAELAILAGIAAQRGATAPVAIRVNPDIDAGTGPKIATGGAEAKFGVPIGRVAGLYAQMAHDPRFRPMGLALHIGSQLTDLGPLEAAFQRLGALVGELKAAGLPVPMVDLGGGLGIPYDATLPPPPTPADYGALVARVTAGWGVRLAFEPGRLLVGNAGILVARVILVKEGAGRRFVVLDAAMNDLIRPTLYGVHHDIVAVKPRPGHMLADVVGPVCETGDRFASQRRLSPLEGGDLVALMTAGAYGATMASNYNSRPLVAETMVDGDRFALVRPRQRLEDLVAADVPAPWLAEESP